MFVIYQDTDSEYCSIEKYIGKFINKDKWLFLSKEDRAKFISEIASEVSKYVNKKSFDILQKETYNTPIDNFRIVFEQESICESFLITGKKKYGYYITMEEGVLKDEVKVKGLEIVQGSTPVVIKPFLKEFLTLLLKNESSDNELISFIDNAKNEIKKANSENIAYNISISNIEKYITNEGYMKGTPAQLKGVYNFRKLLEILNIKDKYEDIHNGDKVMVTYLVKNKFGFENISFKKWIPEFDKVIQVCYNTHIEKFFIKKIKTLLKPINKECLLSNKSNMDDILF